MENKSKTLSVPISCLESEIPGTVRSNGHAVAGKLQLVISKGETQSNDSRGINKLVIPIW